jgi:two-component system, NarL family, response regulator DevR
MTASSDPATRVTTPIRVAIVDDHAIVRQGLQLVLEMEPDITVVGDAPDPAGALHLIRTTRPDLVLLDLKLAEEGLDGGIDLCAEITRDYPDVDVVVLTTFLEQNLVLRAIRSGARGYVLKDTDALELVRIIRRTHRGEPGFGSGPTAVLMQSVSSEAAETAALLTPREQEILQNLSRGLTNSEIGRTCYISESAVKFHLRNIMRKLEVRNRTELLYAAMKRGLL